MSSHDKTSAEKYAEKLYNDTVSQSYKPLANVLGSLIARSIVAKTVGISTFDPKANILTRVNDACVHVVGVALKSLDERYLDSSIAKTCAAARNDEIHQQCLKLRAHKRRICARAYEKCATRQRARLFRKREY